jgi:hypothetical protein
MVTHSKPSSCEPLPVDGYSFFYFGVKVWHTRYGRICIKRDNGRLKRARLIAVARRLLRHLITVSSSRHLPDDVLCLLIFSEHET